MEFVDKKNLKKIVRPMMYETRGYGQGMWEKISLISKTRLLF